MQLEPIDMPELIELAAGWLADKDNYQWLDFGAKMTPPSPLLVKIMTQQDTHFLRVFTDRDGSRPIGVVGFNNVDHVFKTATYWVVLGDKAHAGQGYATRASSKLLTLGFDQLGLHAINTWCVEGNFSVRMVERLNFKLIGRQRQCHRIDGKLLDRLLYDLLRHEHVEID